MAEFENVIYRDSNGEEEFEIKPFEFAEEEPRFGEESYFNNKYRKIIDNLLNNFARDSVGDILSKDLSREETEQYIAN